MTSFKTLIRSRWITRLRRSYRRRWFALKYPHAASLPYPVLVDALPAEKRYKSSSRGVEVFDGSSCEQLNRARIDHLHMLGLPLSGKKVLDAGCGIGHLSEYFIRRECEVTCVDARERNIAELRRRYPDVTGAVVDIERDSLTSLGRFDVVLCYGLLYHLESPIAALRNMSSVCNEILLLETQVCDTYLPIMRVEDEPRASNQAVNGVGHRPSPSYVVMALNRIGFNHIYIPTRQPDHEDFGFEWYHDMWWTREGHNLRCVFVAARSPLESDVLVSALRPT